MQPSLHFCLLGGAAFALFLPGVRAYARAANFCMHQVHRDVKPGNVLLNSRGEVKISDFGLSAELDSTKEMCATFIGTHAYMSPERLGGKQYSFASDIWSLGITLVECALGQFPYTAYTGSNYFVLLSQILNDPPPQLPETFSQAFRDFILLCLCKEPEQRPSAEQLLKHEFIRMYDDALRPFDMAVCPHTAHAREPGTRASPAQCRAARPRCMRASRITTCPVAERRLNDSLSTSVVFVVAQGFVRTVTDMRMSAGPQPSSTASTAHQMST